MALQPGESTESPDIQYRVVASEQDLEAAGAYSLLDPEGAKRRALAKISENATDLTAMTPQERIQWMKENKGKAYKIAVKSTVGQANADNTESEVVPGTESSELSEEDKAKLEEEKQARLEKKRKALAAMNGQRPVKSAIPGISYGEGDTNTDFMSLSDDAIESFADGLSDEEIDRLAAEYDEPTWYESAGLAVTDGVSAVSDAVDTAMEKAAEAYDYAQEKLEEANEAINEGIDWIKENVFENEYFKIFSDAFTDAFCSMQPFPACLSCPHRKANLDTTGLNLYNLLADVQNWIKKGIYDKVSSLIDCPGLAGAIANGDLGSLKNTMMTKGLDALVLGGINLGTGAVFGVLGSVVSSAAGKVGLDIAQGIVKKYAPAAMKSIRSGHFNLLSGTMKLCDIKADSLFRISTKNTNYQFVNSIASSPSYLKALYREYGMGTTPVTAATLPASAKAGVDALKSLESETKSSLRAEADKAAALMKSIDNSGSAESDSIKALAKDVGATEAELKNAGIIDHTSAESEELAKASKNELAKKMSLSASLLAESSPATPVLSDETTLSADGIRTRRSSITATRMSELYGCTASLHDLKIAYAADHRLNGRRLPNDVRARRRRRGGTIIHTKSDLLFAS